MKFRRSGKYRIVTILAALALFLSTASGAVSPTERDALMALYNSTSGANWSNNTGWGGAVGTECSWHGVTCDAAETMVTKLELSGNGLLFTLPSELGNLSHLQGLYLDNNQLTGSLPPELGNLVQLQGLDLAYNQLTGSLPLELGNLVQLQGLDLAYNQLTGSLPPEIGNLVQLQGLYLDNNQLTGSLPPEIGNLVQLQGLYLAYNQLTGSLPPEIGNLSQLLGLYLDNNQLTGSLPPEIGNLVQLQEIDLDNNQLTGSLPPEIGNLSQLQGLELDNNQLTGSLPPEIGNLVQLEWLHLGYNQLKGAIPPEIGNFSQLQELLLDNNQLTGTIPPEIGNFSQLKWLLLLGNALEGPLPVEFQNLVELNVGDLDLRWNKLWTTNTILRDFLNGKQDGGDWESTQNIAPANATAGSPTDTTITVGWTPIQYTADAGGYQVSYATTSGGPYTLFGTTADKSAASLAVTGLQPGTTYCFIVQSRTDPHANNGNTLVSLPSNEACATTTGQASSPSLTIPANVPAAAGAPVEVPVQLATNGAEIAGISFSVDFDAPCLDFDPTDGNGDGLPDAITFPGVPAGFTTSASFDAADTDGELDVTIFDATPAGFPGNGDLAVVTFATTCFPTSGTQVAAVGFSAVPAPTFSDVQARDLPGTWQNGSVEIVSGTRGDCNGDGFLSVADVIACSKEITDGDGSHWLDVPGGAFPGNPVGCDSNADTTVDAGDVSCTILKIFNGACAAGGAGVDSGTGSAQLRMPRDFEPRSDGTIVVPIDFVGAGHSIVSTVLSLDLDPTRVTFDPADADGDGLPDAVALFGTPRSWTSAEHDPNDSDSELDVLLADLLAEPRAMVDGRLLEITLQVLDPGASLDGAVRFATDPAPSFGDADGQSVAGEGVLVEPSSSVIFIDGFESGDLSQW